MFSWVLHVCHTCTLARILQLPKDSNSPENWLNFELVIKSPLLLVQDSVLARGMLHIHTIAHVR